MPVAPGLALAPIRDPPLDTSDSEKLEAFLRMTMVILFALFAISAEAQQSIGSIDDVARIERGGTIHVSTAAAAEIKGTFIRPKGTVLTMTAKASRATFRSRNFAR